MHLELCKQLKCSVYLILFPSEEKGSSIEIQDCQTELLEGALGLQATRASELPGSAQAGAGSTTTKHQGHSQ